MMDILFDILVWVIVFLSVLLLGFWLYLTSERMKEVSRLQKIDRYIEEKQHKWYRYFKGEEPFSDELIPKHKHEIEGIEKIFLVYLKNISSTEIQDKIRDFSNRYLMDHYQKLLDSRKWSRRMNALYRVADFQLYRLVYKYREMEKKKLTHEENFQLLKIYSMFEPDLFIEKIANTMKLSEFEYKKLLTGIDPNTRERLMTCFDQLPPACQYSMIDTIGMIRNMDSIPFLEAQLDHSDAEIRIRSLKALHEIGIIVNLDRYIPFVTSDIWEERLMAAKLLQNVPLKGSLSYLEKLLKDESWLVRTQAALAIEK
ncbi:HEAT repeat domain-containing protein [Siminovitchia terrae]|uniref:HEAT repeat domain-containing protein n=1 Tax=Siminovitchia terrae TaxID=1914933 RepID=UPI0028AFB4EF|nr:HEAT repeat domain-containing protein [Siminovitchia terrae]